MRAINYQRNWNSKLSAEEELELMFGKLLIESDESEAYEQDGAMLFKKGRKYYYLQSNGCSCWDGDWDGFELTLPELRKWAAAKSEDGYEKAAIEVARFVKENL